MGFKKPSIDYGAIERKAIQDEEKAKAVHATKMADFKKQAIEAQNVALLSEANATQIAQVMPGEDVIDTDALGVQKRKGAMTSQLASQLGLK